MSDVVALASIYSQQIDWHTLSTWPALFRNMYLDYENWNHRTIFRLWTFFVRNGMDGIQAKRVMLIPLVRGLTDRYNHSWNSRAQKIWYLFKEWTKYGSNQQKIAIMRQPIYVFALGRVERSHDSIEDIAYQLRNHRGV